MFVVPNKQIDQESSNNIEKKNNCDNNAVVEIPINNLNDLGSIKRPLNSNVLNILIKHGPFQPKKKELKIFPKKKIGKQYRSIQESWYESKPWLTYSNFYKSKT